MSSQTLLPCYVKRNACLLALLGSSLLGTASPLHAQTQSCQGLLCTIIGSDRHDEMRGTDGADVICGLRGNDRIFGGGGDDLICGGDGHDELHGEAGNDVLVGGQGHDKLYGGEGADELDGNQGKDHLDGGPGGDLLLGGLGQDQLLAGDGLDTCQSDRHDRITQCEQTQAQTQASKGHFSMIGENIYAPDGHNFIVRGVNIFPWHRGSATRDAIGACWRFNTVRLHGWIFPQAHAQWKDHIVYVDEPVIFDPHTTELSSYDIRPLIEAYSQENIVVILDIHEYLGGFIQGQALNDYLAFITDFARKFRDNPYVWLDIHNEPGSYEGRSSDFHAWREEVITIVDAVRAVAPHMPMLIPGGAWGQDTGPDWSSALVNPAHSVLLSNPDVFSRHDNLIATLHLYDQWTFGLTRLADYVERLYATLNVPLIVGEYGAVNNTSTLSASQALHGLIDQPRFASSGRIVWTWDALDSNDLTTSGSGGGQSVDSCTNPQNLSPLGRLVWDDTHP